MLTRLLMLASFLASSAALALHKAALRARSRYGTGSVRRIDRGPKVEIVTKRPPR